MAQCGVSLRVMSSSNQHLATHGMRKKEKREEGEERK